MNSDDKGLQAALRVPFNYLADSFISLLNMLWHFILIPVDMGIALFDSSTP